MPLMTSARSFNSFLVPSTLMRSLRLLALSVAAVSAMSVMGLSTFWFSRFRWRMKYPTRRRSITSSVHKSTDRMRSG